MLVAPKMVEQRAEEEGEEQQSCGCAQAGCLAKDSAPSHPAVWGSWQGTGGVAPAAGAAEYE